MLEIENAHAAYGKAEVLRGVSLQARPGEIFCLLGRNGAGKTTVMKTIMGLLPLSRGRIALHGADIANLPAHEIAGRRIGYVPQGRRLFAGLSVQENIEMGLRAGKSGAGTKARVLDMFPRLGERLGQPAGTLSGGEQQMLATARALCIQPEVLLLDEPTEGLQPSMIEMIRNVIVQMREEGLIVLLVEQRIDAVLSVADRVGFMENGRSLETLTAAELRQDPARLHRRLGV